MRIGYQTNKQVFHVYEIYTYTFTYTYIIIDY